MSPLICARCGQEIVPGSAVEFISEDDPAEARIMTSDQALVVHAECPPAPSRAQRRAKR